MGGLPPSALCRVLECSSQGATAADPVDVGPDPHNVACAPRCANVRVVLHSGLLGTFRRIGVWPDSVQALGGTLDFGLPTRSRVWLYSGLRTAGRRDEAWLKRGLPSS